MQPLEVLALLESRLEEIIALASALPAEVVAARENACEKERRQVSATYTCCERHWGLASSGASWSMFVRRDTEVIPRLLDSCAPRG